MRVMFMEQDNSNVLSSSVYLPFECLLFEYVENIFRIHTDVV